ncbi:Protein N-terminal amidase [Cytospora mali]|uniref:Protein N-terminal amidase n=1 Tax=Cytospora mali TaxID=578113 RepID=A0A194UYM4_CYTMA|nr:Protein N-terminal amidase [Valsa mali var. pyri (nom. inval.)]
MRIGCLQFAPRVGDIDNNLNRADSVLAKANPDDLDSLDLLVLPELAFTGYNFKSLQQISPYLEPSGSGISSLWARTTALKYNTNVVVGYPERVDVSTIWPTGPEYYNSAIVVNGDGETIANYRKSFLYSVDESWALEGKDGFFHGHIDGLGQTAMGICMDLNPYKFEAPWHSFEFAFHILEIRAHLVIVTMAWLTREDKSHFSSMPAEPDMESLTYWIQRLEPVIRAEDDEEVIVVFCNRTGSEDDAVYAGTSAVVGIKEGEVHVYGLLGRGSKEVLVVDTQQPIAKLVHRPEVETTVKSSHFGEAKPYGAAKTKGAKPEEAEPATYTPQASFRKGPTTFSKANLRKGRSVPRLEIPEQRYRTTSTSHGTPIEESPSVPTPTAPSPTPLSARPKLAIPGTRLSRKRHKDTPYTQGDEIAVKGQNTGSVSISNDNPITPYSDLEHPTEKYFRHPSQTLLETTTPTPMSLPPPDPSLPASQAYPESPSVASFLIQQSSGDHPLPTDARKSKGLPSQRSEGSSSRSTKSGRKSQENEKPVPARPATTNTYTPVRPASPKSRNTSKSGRHEQRKPRAEEPDMDAMTEGLEVLRWRSQSAMAQQRDRTETPADERPKSPKSRNASRSGRQSDMDFPFMERDLYSSRGFNPRDASDSGLGANILWPRDIPARDQRWVNGSATQPIPDTHHHPISHLDRAGSQVEDMLKFSQSPNTQAEPVESRTALWSEISKIVGEHMGHPDSQEVTRGRQRNPSAAPDQPRQGSREALTNVRAASSQMRPESGGIRSVREPSMGAPADPDDEIVAEIIFRRPGYPAHTSRSNSRGTAGTPDQRVDRSSSRKDSFRPNPDDNLVQRKSAPSQLGNGGSKPLEAKMTEKEGNSVPSPPITRQLTREDLGEASPPGLVGSPIHTLNSGKPSPPTPSLGAFKPTTPKAMMIPQEYGSLLSTASDSLTNIIFESTNSLTSEQTVVQLERPRSSVW